VAAEDVAFGKPHPEPFLRAHEKLRDRDNTLSVSECVAIEDSIGGIQSARQAGMQCLGIAHSYTPDRLRRAGPNWIIDSMANFVPWLKKEVLK
jgi:beta-phosphoglucomutase-like phosphatase (HAD superfamily)